MFDRPSGRTLQSLRIQRARVNRKAARLSRFDPRPVARIREYRDPEKGRGLFEIRA